MPAFQVASISGTVVTIFPRNFLEALTNQIQLQSKVTLKQNSRIFSFLSLNVYNYYFLQKPLRGYSSRNKANISSKSAEPRPLLSWWVGGDFDLPLSTANFGDPLNSCWTSSFVESSSDQTESYEKERVSPALYMKSSPNPADFRSVLCFATASFEARRSQPQEALYNELIHQYTDIYKKSKTRASRQIIVKS